MKIARIFTLSAALLFSQSVFADIIVLADGTTLNVCNVERGSKSIIYTETDSPDAPVRKIPISDCFAIKIGDGVLETVSAQAARNEVVESPQAVPKEVNMPKFVEPRAAVGNQARLDAINLPVFKHRKNKQSLNKKKHTDPTTFVLGTIPNSILEDDNVIISFEYGDPYVVDENATAFVRRFEWKEGKVSNYGKPTYKIVVTNKSDKKVYVDLVNSYRIMPDGRSETLYNDISVSHSNGSAVGGSVNLGAVAGAFGIGGAVGTLASGIGIGGSSNQGVTVVEGNPAMLVIPPGTKMTIPKSKHLDKNKKYIENHEYFNLTDKRQTKESLDLEKYEFVEIPYTSDSKTQKYLISYSTEPNFSTYTTLSFGFYYRASYGIPTTFVQYYSEEDFEGPIPPLWF